MALVTLKQHKAVAARLRAERERLGFTEKQIAQLIGIPIEQYQKVEDGLVLRIRCQLHHHERTVKTPTGRKRFVAAFSGAFQQRKEFDFYDARCLGTFGTEFAIEHPEKHSVQSQCH